MHKPEVSTFKRVLSGVLAAVMCAGFIPSGVTTAHAVDSVTDTTTLYIETVNNTTKAPLEQVGVRIECTTAGRYHDYGTAYSDSHGKISLEMPVGFYRLTATAAPEGYRIDPNPHNVYIQKDGTTVAPVQTIVAYALSPLVIKKIDADTQDGISGVEFTVYNKDKNKVATGTTDAAGFLTIPNLLPGDYTVEESNPPAGYHPSPAQTITIKENETGVPSLLFVDSEKNVIAIRKTDKATGEPLAGAHFKVETAGGVAVVGGNDLVTNSEGMAYLSNLAAGEYKVSEISAPEGYLIDQRIVTFSLTQKTENKVIPISDSRPGGLIVYSKDSNGQPLAGTHFILRDKDNHQIGVEKVTDENGRVFFEKLDNGDYTIIATKATPGYILQTNTIVRHVDKNQIADAMFISSRCPEMIIECEDENGNKIQDARFNLTGPDGKVTGPYVTSAQGFVKIEGLDAGHYLIAQTGVPAGYVITTATQSRNLTAGETEHVKFVIKSKPYIEISHYVRGTTTALAGAKFELWQGNSKIQEGYVGADGHITFENVQPGQYTVRHVSTPDGYTIDTATQNIEVLAGSSGYLQFTSSRDSSILISKVDKATGKPLPGAVFQIRDLNGNVLETVQTQMDGTATSKTLTAGQYMVNEISAPDGYIPNETARIVTVVADQICDQRFTNEKMSAIVVNAIDRTGLPVSHAQFTVTSLETGKLVDTIVTDGAGVAVTKALDPGRYVVRETLAPAGFVMETKVLSDVVVSTDDATHLTFMHSTKSVIQIRNEDSSGNPISGGQFKVVNQATGEVVGYYTTDESGIVTTPIVTAGTYQVSQVVAADGYTTKNETYTVVVKDNQASIVRFVNGVNSVLHIKKTDSKTGAGLGQVVFTLADDSGHVLGRYTTDSTGCLDIKNLEPGNYLLREYQAADGYVIDEACRTNIVIKADEPTYIALTNTKKPVIQIAKEDAETYERIAGAEFTVKKGNNIVATVTSDTDGLATTHELEPGTYTVFESKAPAGYTLNPAPVTVTVRPGLTSSIVIRDSKTSGLIVTKTNELGNPLAGADYTLYDLNGDEIAVLTTQVNGTASYPNLDAGYYVLRETKAPVGYKLDTTPKVVNVKAETGASVKFIDKSLSSIVINKTDADTGIALAGAKFEVTDTTGNVVANLQSDKAGLAQTGVLADGTYYVKETAAPNGYMVDTSVRTVNVVAGEAIVLNITNSAKAAVHIHLNDAVTKVALDNGTFVVKNKLTGIVVGQGKTENGILIVPSLPDGDYVVSQIAAPENYIKDTISQDITVTANKVIHVYFLNQPMTGLRIENVVLGTHAPLAEGIFEVYDKDGKQVYHGTTDDTGILDTGIIAPGKYTIKQMATAEGYTIVTSTQTVMVTVDKPTTAVFENKPLTCLLINKIDKETRAALEGATFRVQSVRGAFETIVTTNVDGLATVDNLKPGYYVVTETKAPDGYVLAGTYQFAYIRSDKNTELTFTNQKNTGLLIENVVLNTHDPLSGGKFEVWALNTNHKVFEGTTDTTGVLDVGILAPGQYLIKQVATLNGYTIMTGTQTIEVKTDVPSHAVFYNMPSGNLDITKVDEESRAPLAGATFKIVKENTNIEKVVTTDGSGVAHLGDLPVGNYVVTETIAPEGYRLNNVAQNVVIRSGETAALTFANPKLTGIVINKTDANTGVALAGAIFEVAHQNGKIVDTFTTDSDGHIETGTLTPGMYTIKELTAPEGYIRSTAVQTVEVTENEPTIVAFTNRPMTGIVITKVEEKTNKPLAGAQFDIIKNGNVVMTLTTNEDGVVDTGAIEPGDYTVKEVKAPDGYILTNATQSAKVVDTNAVNLRFVNKPMTGIIINKTDAYTGEALEGAQFKISVLNGKTIGTFTTDDAGRIETDILEPGKYTIEELIAPTGYVRDEAVKTVTVTDTEATIVDFTNKPMTNIVIDKVDGKTGKALAGAMFEITKGGVTVATLTTDSDGHAETDVLAPGQYTVRETKAPAGYIIDMSSKTVTVGTQAPTKLRLTNSAMTNIVIHKTDAVTGEDLAGAQFEITRQDGSVVGEYTTDAAGLIQTEILEPGVYTVKETVAPNGYICDDATKTVEVKTDESTIVPFTNKQKTGIVIEKSDAFTGAPLANAQFEILDSQGNRVNDNIFVTDEAGHAETGMLQPGTYTVKELVAPVGYVVDSAVKVVVVKNTEPTLVNFTNKPMAGIVIYKTDAKTGAPLADAEFDVINVDGIKAHVVTDETGYAETGKLAPGEYTIKETKAPDGYIAEPVAKTVTVGTKDNVTVNFTNKAMTRIIIDKVDANTHEPLAGAEFRVETKNGTLINTYTTESTGRIETELLMPGEYTIKETKAPAGYMIDTTIKTVEVGTDTPTKITFTNKPMVGIFITKTDAATGLPLAGAKFSVVNSYGVTVIAELTTDEAGHAETGILKPGKYTVKEIKAPDGYVLDASAKTIVVTDTEPALINFTNKAQSTITVNKLDSRTGALLQGAKFNVYAQRDNSLVAQLVTDAQGSATTTPLAPGKYVLKETMAPLGYQIDSVSRVLTLEANKNLTVEFTNTANPSLEIHKLDSVTRNPLAGASFDIFNDMGTKVADAVTGENGIAVVTNLVPGKYRVLETKAPQGYIMDTTSQTVEVRPAALSTLTFLNEPMTGIMITKVDNKTNEPLAGAVFEISEVNGNRVNEFTTDASGVINTEALDPGKYLIREIKAPEGYILDDASQIVEVVAGETTNVRITNTKMTSLQIWKMDEITGDKLAGAKFSITNALGEQVTTVETGADGVGIIPNLKPGKYTVTEIEAPEGYMLDSAPQNIEVKTSNSEIPVLKFYDKPLAALRIDKVDGKTGEKLPGAVFKITKENGDYVGEFTTEMDGQIVIPQCDPGRYVITEISAPAGYIVDNTAHTVEVRTGVPTVITIENNRTAGIQIRKTITQTGEPLQGVSFKVKTAEGKLIGNYVTDAMGLIYVSVDPGEYVIQETFAPNGFVMKQEPYFVTVGENEPTVLEITNDRMSNVRIHKIDAESGKGIYGVTFEIKDSHNNYIGTYKTDDQGYIDLTAVLPDGRYVVTETQAAPGYIIDPIPRTIKVSSAEPTEIIWENAREKGQVEIHKFSADDNANLNIPANTPLEGAEFTITTLNGQVIDTVKTNANGVAYTGALDLGSYLIQETKAPAGYTINGKAIQIDITSKSQKKVIEVYNKTMNIAVNIEKRGENKVRPGNSMKYYLMNIKNASNVAMDNFFFTDILPTDSVRAQTLYTGTWSNPVYYKIEYKTNMFDFRDLATGLNSKTQYSFDLSSQALNMETGEYVTQIRFVFGTVPAEFHEEVSPVLYTYVLPHVLNNYQIINRCEVGGQYNGNWYTDADTWTTVAVKPSVPLPPSLPTTGF